MEFTDSIHRLRAKFQSPWANDVAEVVVGACEELILIELRVAPSMRHCEETLRICSMCCWCVLLNSTTCLRYTMASCHLTLDKIASILRWKVLSLLRERMAYLQSNRCSDKMWIQYSFCLHHQYQFANICYHRQTLKRWSLCQLSVYIC